MTRGHNQRFPSVDDIERVARRRLPKYMSQYLRYGMGKGGGVRRNRGDLDAVQLLPRYCVDAPDISTQTHFCGQSYSVPFGVAPVGNGGLAWPGAPQALAKAAKVHQLPFVSSTFTFASLESIRALAGEFAWFQLYRPNRPDVEEDLLNRAHKAGYTTLVVTVDVPGQNRRAHDIRNGFSLPPRLWDLPNLFQMLCSPAWSWAVAQESLKNGFPQFENLTPYLPPNLSTAQALAYQSQLVTGHVSPEKFALLRERWPSDLLVKGILDPVDARRYRELGADGLIVSNHGGRQLESAPSAVAMLPSIREAVGSEYPLIADGGVRTGQDICRMIALGADFVLLGRAFYLAVAAMGLPGADYVMGLLKSELQCTMAQLGCRELTELPGRLPNLPGETLQAV